MTRTTKVTWTEAQIIRLAQLSCDGASVNRAAAALNRTTSAVKNIARRYNLPLVGVRQAKAAIRQLDTIDRSKRIQAIDVIHR